MASLKVSLSQPSSPYRAKQQKLKRADKVDGCAVCTVIHLEYDCINQTPDRDVCWGEQSRNSRK